MCWYVSLNVCMAFHVLIGCSWQLLDCQLENGNDMFVSEVLLLCVVSVNPFKPLCFQFTRQGH